jgi:tetratricopeptide (TPR) repeat protein
MKWMILVVALSATAVSAEQFQLGGKPAPLQSPYKSEHEWAIAETAADILDVAAVIRGSRPAALEARPAKPWNPDLFVPFARSAVGTVTAKDGSSLPAQYVALADPTALTLVRANEAVSAAMRQHPASPRAHEAAALLLATFGCEAANDLSDLRWTLNRITAHLALAEALRGSAPASVDGQLASVAFYALANRTATGLRLLDGMTDGAGDRPLSSWKRALRLRLTHDWRTAPEPMRGHRIEKLEHFRARRKTLRTLRAGQDLSALNEPGAADFTRIIQTFPYTVEDGHQYVSDALGGELLELAEVYRAMHRRELPPRLPAEIINARPVRLMQHTQPMVLPWGAWAEFFQRHIGMYVAAIDDFQRRMLVLPNVADQTKAALDAGLRHLTLFPIASSRRTKGRGLEADLTFINQAVDLASRAPELVNYDYWLFLDMGARYEMVRAGMPPPVPWFAAPSADVPYDAGLRVQGAGAIATPDLEALVAEASSDVSLASRALAPRPGNQKLIAHVVSWLKARGEYDLWAVNAAVRWARTLPEEIEWQRYGCAIAITECLDLAWLLARVGDEKGAVAEYERAFRDPGIDVVTMANNVGWLVSYYERAGQMQRAYDLAERAAATGSGAGITTLARLYERRNRAEEAAALYDRLANRYVRSNDELAGFLYRQAIVANRAAYLARWRSVEKALFPRGLQPVPAAMPAQPAGGVFVYNDSNTTRRVRLQTGDIIVGVDGWLVENKEQYNAVMAFGDPNAMHKVTAWRGVLFTVDLPESNGADLQTHPLKGWIQ